jgi:hypothetical protein
VGIQLQARRHVRVHGEEILGQRARSLTERQERGSEGEEARERPLDDPTTFFKRSGGS